MDRNKFIANQTQTPAAACAKEEGQAAREFAGRETASRPKPKPEPDPKSKPEPKPKPKPEFASQERKPAPAPYYVRDLSDEGDGIAVPWQSEDEKAKTEPSRSVGPIIFVASAIPGDLVEVEAEGEHPPTRRPRRVETFKLLKASEDRRAAFCPHYPACGGCRLQHMSYEAGLRWKRRRVVELLRRVGGMTIDGEMVKELIAATNPFRYRNKVRLHLTDRRRETEDGGMASWQMGFHERASHRILDQTDCRIQPEIFEALRERLRSNLTGAQTVQPESVIFRSKQDQSAAMLILELPASAAACSAEELKEQYRPLTQSLAAEKELSIHLALPLPMRAKARPSARRQQNGAKSLRDNDSEPEWQSIHLHGEEKLPEEVCGLQFRLSPTSFFQTNLLLNEGLFLEVAELAKKCNPKRVLDLYCGVGSLSLMIARALPQAEVTGVEILPEAVRDARDNARLNQISNASFDCGRAEEWMMTTKHHDDKPFDLIVLDPPREGLDAALRQALQQSGAAHILYISCHPATLARDLSVLKADYQLESVQPLDMFPWTTHVETVVLMSRVDK